MVGREKKRRRGLWIALVVVIALLIPVAVVAVPILLHQNSGESGQIAAETEWPTEVTATGADDRVRSFTVASADGALDTSTLEPGEKLIVSGNGYDARQGIYVAICKIPEDSATKPGPCLGGVPDQQHETVAEGTVQYAPSNWINDAFAWKLFGSRSYDNEAGGTFTAYLEVGEPTGDGLDCTVDACGIFTRNDHTAMNDRVQDLYVPVGFAAAG